MPLAQIRGVSCYLNNDHKQHLIERVTDAILAVESE